MPRQRNPKCPICGKTIRKNQVSYGERGIYWHWACVSPSPAEVQRAEELRKAAEPPPAWGPAWDPEAQPPQ